MEFAAFFQHCPGNTHNFLGITQSFFLQARTAKTIAQLPRILIALAPSRLWACSWLSIVNLSVDVDAVAQNGQSDCLTERLNDYITDRQSIAGDRWHSCSTEYVPACLFDRRND